MASTTNITPAPAQQPGLRSFIVYDRLPAGCAAFPVTDNRNRPHLYAGEMVVIDPTDRQPCEGELFAVEWLGGARGIIETFKLEKLPGWCVGAVQPNFIAERAGVQHIPPGRWCDFGYSTEVLAEKLLGRIVGILEPSFAEPARLVAEGC